MLLIISAPLAQGGKGDEELVSHCLKLRGSYLNLSILLDKKKFRTYGHKREALRGFSLLKEDDIEVLEHCGGRGVNNYELTHVTKLIYFSTMGYEIIVNNDPHSCTTSKIDPFQLMMMLMDGCSSLESWQNMVCLFQNTKLRSKK